MFNSYKKLVSCTAYATTFSLNKYNKYSSVCKTLLPRSYDLNTKPFLFNNKRNTTILCVRKNGRVVMAGDGQVSLGPTVVKGIYKLY